MKKIITKLITTVFAITITTCSLNISTVKAESMDYSSEPIIYGTEYEGTMSWGREDLADKYKLVVPVDAKVFVDKYYCDNSRELIYLITNNKTKESVKMTTDQAGDSNWGKNKPSDSTYLKKGTYTVKCYFANVGGGTYHFTFNIKPSVPDTVKVSSPAKGKIKVSLPKGTGATFYEIQYSNGGSWDTKTVKTSKNLNTVFSVKHGTYKVRVRKGVTDSYGYTYYSNYTKAKSVKVK